MILAVDIGTSRAKAALFDLSGSCRAIAAADYEDLQPLLSTGKEIDARLWLHALGSMIADLSRTSRRDAIQAIVICGNGPTILPIDAEGEPLAPAMSWLDRRATEEAEEAARILGHPLDAAFNLPKILWLKKHRPELYEAAHRFVSCPEFVIGRLTGSWTTCVPNPGYTAIIWDEAALRTLDLDERKFPPSVPIGAVVGYVHQNAAATFGLPRGIPVIMGGPDFFASLLGTATVAPGRTCDKGGTSEGVNLCAEKPSLRREERTPSGYRPEADSLLVMPHIIEPYFNISGVISTSGKALAWFRDTFLPGESFESIYSRAAAIRPGSDGLVFLPYLAGERSPHWDPEASALFVGLRLEHTRDHMARAVLESVAFAIREVISVMESIGAKPVDLRATGLPSLSPLWNQIKADITGLPLMVPEFREPELAGCFAIGLTALGETPGFVQAAEFVFSPGRVFEPRADTVSRYEDCFYVYRESYARLRDLFPVLRKASMREQ
ncbi:MAG: FGGY family carbohydrate kinase [Rectinema sp.]|nr:FGGY family carbohydrate kinase [Rectinema sp.]